jgi:hypothetical protein
LIPFPIYLRLNSKKYSYAKAEISVELADQRAILSIDKVTASNESITYGLTNNQGLDNGIKCLTNQNILLLLLIIWVNQESARCHDIHVVVLGTSVNIDCLSIQYILVALNVEFVRGEDFATLNQDPKRVLKE